MMNKVLEQPISKYYRSIC